MARLLRRGVSVRDTFVVVLELGRWMGSMRALRRARALAQRKGARLVVLIVCAPILSSSGPDIFHVLDAMMKRVAATTAATVLLRTGEICEVVRRAVVQERPALLIVGDATASGALWADLATALDVPIFIARRSRKDGRVLAATDATDRSFPTLSRGAALAPARSPLVVFHVFDAWNEATRLGHGPQVSTALLCDLTENRAHALERAAERRSPPAEIVVASGHEPAAAVLEQCARTDPDVVVIGAHRHRPLGRGRTRTSAALIERLTQSVLVVPLHAMSSL